MFSMLDINDISTVQDFHHRILLQSPTDTVTTPQGNTYLPGYTKFFDNAGTNFSKEANVSHPVGICISAPLTNHDTTSYIIFPVATTLA